jgi:hypothetical protein
MMIDDDDLLDCFVNLPDTENVPFVLNYQTIANTQRNDVILQHLRQQKPHMFAQQMVAYDVNLICYIPGPNASWKICLPTGILDQAVRWYHLVLSHIGQNCCTIRCLSDFIIQI